MRVFAAAAVLGFVPPAFPYTKTYGLSHNPVYDHEESSLSNIACSNGEYGLLTLGYNTFGSLFTYPYVGGAPQILSWNSRYCGSCWELTYTDQDGVSESLNFTAIDTGDPEGFSISLEGIDLLTGGHASELDSILITATRIPRSACGL